MFKKTVNLTEFKANAPDLLALLGDDGDDDALQLIHRGAHIKVVMTQERYFRLLEKIRAYEEQAGKRKPKFVDVDTPEAEAEFDREIEEAVKLANSDGVHKRKSRKKSAK